MIISRRSLLQALAVGAVSAMAPPILSLDLTGDTRAAIKEQEKHFSALGKYDFWLRSVQCAMLADSFCRIEISASATRCRLDAKLISKDFAIYNDFINALRAGEPVTLDWSDDIYLLHKHKVCDLSVTPESQLIDITTLCDDTRRFLPI